jgi:hypothetical protein
LKANELATEKPILDAADYLSRFSKASNLSEGWEERFNQALLRWITEASEGVKADVLSCIQELELSSKKPGRTRKLFSGLFKECLKHLAKDPGGKCRYKWADKAYFMRQELKLSYEFIYPAVCQEATGKRLEDLSESERREFEEQCRNLVYQRRVSNRNERANQSKTEKEATTATLN